MESNQKGDHTEGGYDYNLCPIGDQFTKGLGEGQIPTDQHADSSEGRIDRLMALLAGRSKMGSFRMPNILLAIGAQDSTIVGDEISDIV